MSSESTDITMPMDFDVRNLIWHTRVKEGYRFLSVPSAPQGIAWQRILDKVLGDISPGDFQSTPQFICGTLRHTSGPFIACTFLDLGPLPDPDEHRPISHAFIWFMPSLSKGIPPNIPNDWHRHLFRLLLPVRNQVYDNPLSQPVVDEVRNSLTPVELRSESEILCATWVDRGIVDDTKVEKGSASRRPAQSSTGRKGKDHGRHGEKGKGHRHFKAAAPLLGAIGGGVAAVAATGANVVSATVALSAAAGATLCATIANLFDHGDKGE